MALAFEHLDETDFVFGSDAGDHADVIDLSVGLIVTHCRELGARDGATWDSELASNGRRGYRVIPGDHPDLDAGVSRFGDRFLCFGPGRIHDSNERQDSKLVDER